MAAAEVAAAAAGAAGGGAKRGTPLDRLHSQLDAAAEGLQAHPRQRDLVARLGPEGLGEFGSSAATMLQLEAEAAEEAAEAAERDATLLASMPEQLRRMSTDGIISMDTLRVSEWANSNLCGCVCLMWWSWCDGGGGGGGAMAVWRSIWDGLTASTVRPAGLHAC